ncbi:MAG: BrnT family toxin [Planctomycetes bacterium]|nr:BrnT family toxin [Planctomycetota bacterium]
MSVERRWSVRGFDWDEANEEHIARHGVTPGEAEEVFLRRMLVTRSRRGRYLVLGQSGAGRHLSVIVERRSGGLVRVVTVRDMSDAERRLYARKRK